MGTKIGAKNVPRSDFWDVGAIWGGPKFRRFWGKKKVDRESYQNLEFEPRRQFAPYFGTGRAECADAAEGLESISSRVLIWRASSPEKGRRIQSLRAFRRAKCGASPNGSKHSTKERKPIENLFPRRHKCFQNQTSSVQREVSSTLGRGFRKSLSQGVKRH